MSPPRSLLGQLLQRGSLLVREHRPRLLERGLRVGPQDAAGAVRRRLWLMDRWRRMASDGVAATAALTTMPLALSTCRSSTRLPLHPTLRPMFFESSAIRSSLAGALAGAATLLALAACGGGPEMGGLEPAEFYGRFSGVWVVDSTVQREVREALAPPRGERERPGMFGEPRGGRGGSPAGPPGGGLPGRGGGPGGGMDRRRGGDVDPETLRTLAEIPRAVAPRLVFDVGEDTVRVEGLEGGPFALPLGGNEVAATMAGVRMSVEARWDGSALVLERKTGPLKVVDRHEVVAGGSRLLVTRSVEGLPGRDREVAWGYDRGGAPSS